MSKFVRFVLAGFSAWFVVCAVSITSLIPRVSLAAPGGLDATFGLQGKTSITLFGADDPTCTYGCFLSGVGAVAAPMGKYLLSGTCQLALNPVTNTHNICVARVLHEGSLDATFGSGGRVVVRNQAAAGGRTMIALGDDGAVFVAATCYYPGGQRVCVTKLDSNGSIDASFGVGGTAYASPSERFGSYVIDASTDIRLSPDGTITVLARCEGNSTLPTNYCLLRFATSGLPDTGFGNAGFVATRLSYGDNAKILPLAGGKLLVVGACQDRYLCMEKYLSNWQIDAAFGTSGTVAVSIGSDVSGLLIRDIQLDSTERVNIAGVCYYPSGAGWTACLSRINSDATLDSTFGTGGRIFIPLQAADNSEFVNALLLQNGKIIVGSACQSTNRDDMCVRAFDGLGGSLSNFGLNGIVRLSFATYSEAVHKLLAADNDKVLVAGMCNVSFGNTLCLARLKGGPYSAISCALNADANNLVSWSDSLLATRYLLGLRGTALTDGAVGPNPGRTNAEIETYLADLLAQGNLDADGDGQSLAMTDGLLILRAMLGLTGDALTAGAVNTAHPNARNAQQILTWIESTHGMACLP